MISSRGWNGHANFVGYSRDGQRVVAAGRRDDPNGLLDGIVAIYAADSGRTLREVPLKQVQAAALSPDGRMIVAAASRALVGIELATGRSRWTNPPQRVSAMQFEASSPWFQAASSDGHVIRFNALTGHEQRRFLAEWRTPEQQKLRRPRNPSLVWGSFGADGRTLVSSVLGWIYVWDVESGTMRRKFGQPRPSGYRVALAPDGRTVATSDLRFGDSGQDTIRLYDVATGRPVLALEPRDDRADVMVFSPDGGRLFTGFEGGTGIVWDLRSGPDAAGAR